MSSDNWFTSSLNPNTSYSTPSRPGTYGNNLSQSSNSTTPQQPFSSYGHSQSQSQNGVGNTGGGGSRARFLGDEMDVEDVNMADNDATKFYTPWGSSPSAAKVGSPGGNSPGIRKSPSARFGITSPDAASPRAGRTARTPFTSISSPEDDAPPTASLRDAQPLSTSPVSSSSFASTSLPAPPSLQPSENTTTLLVFGPPPDQLPNLRGWLEELGPIASYTPGPAGTNWFVVEYVSPVAASYALRRHGDIVGGRWIVGFKVVSNQGGAVNVPRNPGSAIQVQNTEVLKPKKAPTGVVKKPVTEGYSWDENEAPSGVLNKAAEWLFGR